MIDTDDIDQILADPKATTDELRSIIAALRVYYIRHRRDIESDNRRATRHNNETRVSARNCRQAWTVADEAKVLSSPLTAIELAKELGRSMKAIHMRRFRLLNRKPPTP